jgi:hypothetical protein
MIIVREGEGYRLTHRYDNNSAISLYGKDRMGLIELFISDLLYDQENAKEDEEYDIMAREDKLGAI